MSCRLDEYHYNTELWNLIEMKIQLINRVWKIGCAYFNEMITAIPIVFYNI